MSWQPPIPEALWDPIPPPAQQALRAVFAQYEERLQHQQAQIDALRQRLNQNSTNSSKPPSTDAQSPKRRPPQPASGRRRGGQPGRTPTPRPLVPPDQVQQTIALKPAHCRRCGHALSGHDPQPRRHQVAEIPPVQPTVVEYQLHRLACPQCQTRTCATLPAGVPAGCFGPRLQAVLALLAGAYRLGKRPIRRLAHDLFGLSLSLGSIAKLERATAAALEQPTAQALDYVRRRPANVDETSWRQQRRRGWLWVAVTALVSVFLLRPRRDARALQDLVGGQPRRVITSDRFKSYEVLPLERRQVCWSHLRRDFQALIDQGGEAARVGRDLLEVSDDVFFFWQRVRDGTWRRQQFQKHLVRLRAAWDAAVQAGTASGSAAAQALCQELVRLDEALWRFAFQKGVEPTNNAAERALRHAVCWRKTSYGTDSDAGSRFVERILTVVASCRQQGRNVLEYLTVCCESMLHQTTPPSLLPQANTP
jgi:transposase